MANQTGKGGFQKGKSGNQAGRPPKNRALTQILENAGNVKVKVEDKQVTRKELLAQMIWEVSTTGKATLPDGKTLDVAPQDWFGIVKFLYTHIDGAPKTELDVTTAGQPITWESIVKPDDDNEDSDPFA
jgi:hypothetical protein